MSSPLGTPSTEPSAQVGGETLKLHGGNFGPEGAGALFTVAYGPSDALDASVACPLGEALEAAEQGEACPAFVRNLVKVTTEVARHRWLQCKKRNFRAFGLGDEFWSNLEQKR